MTTAVRRLGPPHVGAIGDVVREIATRAGLDGWAAHAALGHAQAHGEESPWWPVVLDAVMAVWNRRTEQLRAWLEAGAEAFFAAVRDAMQPILAAFADIERLRAESCTADDAASGDGDPPGASSASPEM